MNVTVNYEETFQIDIEKAYDLTIQWLHSQYKPKIKKTSKPTFIEAKQGTMMTSTGHDPNWKKKIRINFYQIKGFQTLIRIEASPLSRTIFRVDKLRHSWFEGLFSHLFSLLSTIEKSSTPITTSNHEIKIKICPNCGKEFDEDIIICPTCGIDIY